MDIESIKSQLKEGEKFVCAITRPDGKTTVTILLPGDVGGKTHKDAVEWAESIGGELPTRVEQAVMFEGMRDEFEKDWYWSGERHASVSDYAWIQHFGNGNQGYWYRYGQDRARAVRRLSI